MDSRYVDAAVAEMVRVLAPYDGHDWQATAGSLDWSCWTTAAHVAHDLLAPGAHTNLCGHSYAGVGQEMVSTRMTRQIPGRRC